MVITLGSSGPEVTPLVVMTAKAPPRRRSVTAAKSSAVTFFVASPKGRSPMTVRIMPCAASISSPR